MLYVNLPRRRDGFCFVNLLSKPSNDYSLEGALDSSAIMPGVRRELSDAIVWLASPCLRRSQFESSVQAPSHAARKLHRFRTRQRCSVTFVSTEHRRRRLLRRTYRLQANHDCFFQIQREPTGTAICRERSADGIRDGVVHFTRSIRLVSLEGRRHADTHAVDDR